MQEKFVLKFDIKALIFWFFFIKEKEPKNLIGR